MKANELRLGNWVIGAFMTNVQVNEMLIVNFARDMEDLTPIPLTEEWLLKFGEPAQINELTVEIFTSKGDFIIYKSQCEYVHQYQNLWLDLAGTELQIKETV